VSEQVVAKEKVYQRPNKQIKQEKGVGRGDKKGQSKQEIQSKSVLPMVPK